MNTRTKKTIGTLLLGVLLVIGVVAANHFALGLVSQDSPPARQSGFQNYDFFATSTNQVQGYATSTNLVGVIGYATSTNIISYFDSNGVLDKGMFVVSGAKTVSVRVGKWATATPIISNSKFTFQGTNKSNPTEADWYDIGKVTLATTTNQTLQVNLTIGGTNATTTGGLNLDYLTPYAIRCVIIQTVANDGLHTCSATAKW